MPTVKELFEFEAQNLDPLYQRYRSAPSGSTGAAYVTPALKWLASVQSALQSASIADAYTIPLGARFNVVVGNVNRITSAGHAPQAVGAGADWLGDQLSSLGAAADGITKPTLKIGAGVVLALVAVAVIMVAYRR